LSINAQSTFECSFAIRPLESIPFRKLEPKKRKKKKNADMNLEHVQFGFHEHKPDSLHVRNIAWFLFFQRNI
jgi:hypothetical protein